MGGGGVWGGIGGVLGGTVIPVHSHHRMILKCNAVKSYLSPSFITPVG